jgi:predicted DNA-binding ribbon-helix-helix protein
LELTKDAALNVFYHLCDMQPPPYHPPVKRSVQIAGHKTSISLEPLFWDMLKDAAEQQGIAINALVAKIDAERIKSATPPGLAGAIRVWLVTESGC